MYDPSLPEAYAALALAYLNKKSLDEALTAGQKAIELDQNNYIGYWVLGRIYRTTDRDREALELFKKVVTLNPDFITGYLDLRMVYERLGDEEKNAETLQTALQVFPRHLSKHPDDARGHMLFATDLVQVGRTDEGKAEAARALELSPSDPLMLYNATCFYARLGEKKLALDSFKNAVAAGYANYDWAQRDPDLNTLRDEPEYLELMRGK
jgi:tetratricopeptide (TPR) repeat protein